MLSHWARGLCCVVRVRILISYSAVHFCEGVAASCGPQCPRSVSYIVGRSIILVEARF